MCAVLLGSVLLLSGCTLAMPKEEVTASTSAAPQCTTFSENSHGAEVSSRSGKTTLFGLCQGPGQTPIQASDQVVKVVWRMTGKGDLKIEIKDPSGSTRPLAWGPESHSGSSYDRPGDEWGTGMVFDKPGCWELDFVRADEGRAVLRLSVLPHS